jgi:hypothetical protein
MNSQTLSALGITLFGLAVTPQGIPNNIVNAVASSSYSASVATTALSTVIIAIRILMVSRMPGASRQPRIAMEIIVESAALYSISALVYTLMLANLSLNISVGTYIDYADMLFAYMAVESNPAPPHSHSHLLTFYHRTLPLP